MELMGWSSTSMAARYRHMTAGILRDVAKKVGGLVWEVAKKKGGKKAKRKGKKMGSPKPR